MDMGYGYGYRVHCNVFENTNVEKIEYIEYLNTIWVKSFFVLVPKAGLVAVAVAVAVTVVMVIVNNIVMMRE